jgi:chromosome partitioning protein
MARVLAIVNQKGGVGKTTTAINLSAALSLEGMHCLLVDIDPQANTTAGLGFPQDEDRLSTYDIMVGNTAVAEAILRTEIESLQLVPSSKDLVGATVELIQQENRALKLRKALAAVTPDYDFIVLDCPPALDLLTLNALVASDGLLVPMQAEYFALEGISELMHTLERVREGLNPLLVVEGILLTMYDERTNLTQQVSSNLREHFGEMVFRTTIPRNIRLAEAPSYGRPVALYDPKSRGAESYRELALELLKRNKLSGRKKISSPEASPNMVRFWPYS